MENSLECPVCLNSFTSLRRPKSLTCGHSICADCLSDIVKQKSVQCPLCMEAIKNPDSLAFNWYILERVSFIEVKCANHSNDLATHFHSKLILPLCKDCLENYERSEILDLGAVDLSGFLIQKAIDVELSNSSKITAEQRNKLRQVPVKNNSEKIQLLRNAIKFFDCFKCEQHSLEVISVNLAKGTVLCNECQKSGQEIILTDPHLLELLQVHVHKLSSELDCFYIPPSSQSLIKSFPRNSLEENLNLLKTLTNAKNGERFTNLVPCTCLLCDQEFSYPTNLPCKLPCNGAHYVCEICARQASVCPLDGNYFQKLSKISAILPICLNCEEPFDSNRVPIKLPCGIAKCNQCAFSINCTFCKCDHSVISNEPKNFSKFYLQVIEHCNIQCEIDGKAARGFNIDEMKAYCRKCMQSHNSSKIEDIDIASILSHECYKKAAELGNKVTPTLAKRISDIKTLTNSKKLELYKLLININKPLSSNPTQQFSGLQFSLLSIPGYFYQRFNTLLPSQSSPPSVKPWYIDCKKQQVEAICFKSSRNLVLIGVTITCPVKNEEGLLEYLEVIEGNSLGGKREVRDFVGVRLRGVVADLAFERPVPIRALENYVILFKIAADFVYRGNPLDKNENKGDDGTEFIISEAKQKGFFTNGQGHISGPLVRLIYR